MVRPGDAIGMSTTLFLFFFLLLSVFSPLPNILFSPQITITIRKRILWSIQPVYPSALLACEARYIIAALAISLSLIPSSTAHPNCSASINLYIVSTLVLALSSSFYSSLPDSFPFSCSYLHLLLLVAP